MSLDNDRLTRSLAQLADDPATEEEAARKSIHFAAELRRLDTDPHETARIDAIANGIAIPSTAFGAETTPDLVPALQPTAISEEVGMDDDEPSSQSDRRAATASVPDGELPQHVGDREANRQWWRIDCGDIIGRGRYLTILIDHDRVVLVGPPGETAVLSVKQASQLCDALREASDRAGGRESGGPDPWPYSAAGGSQRASGAAGAGGDVGGHVERPGLQSG